MKSHRAVILLVAVVFAAGCSTESGVSNAPQGDAANSDASTVATSKPAETRDTSNMVLVSVKLPGMT